MDNPDNPVRIKPGTRNEGQPNAMRGVRLSVMLPGAGRPMALFIPREHIITVADALVDTIENEEI